MMAGLFLLLSISIFLILRGYRKTGVVWTLITLILCICMFIYHITDSLNICL